MTKNANQIPSEAPEGFKSITLGKGYAELFGDIFQKSDGNTSKLGFRVQPHHLNHFDSCHGGALAFFADMQLIGVKHLTGNHSGHFPTKQLTIDYISPIKLNEWVEINAELIRMTNKSLYTHATIMANGRCTARTTAIYHVPK